MKRNRRTARQRAEDSVRGLVKQLELARAKVSVLEAELAEVTSILTGVAPKAAMSAAPPATNEKRPLPPALAAPAVQEEAIWHEPPIELADGDDMGPGRFV